VEHFDFDIDDFNIQAPLFDGGGDGADLGFGDTRAIETTAAAMVAEATASRSATSATEALKRLRRRSTTDFTMGRFSFRVREGRRRWRRRSAMCIGGKRVTAASRAEMGGVYAGERRGGE